MNDNRGSLDWVESGCKPTKKLHHENLGELEIAEAQEHGEIQLYWMPGKTNPADLFTKEDNNAQHFELLRDQMVMPWEAFTKLSLPLAQMATANITEVIILNPVGLRVHFDTSTIFHQKLF